MPTAPSLIDPSNRGAFCCLGATDNAIFEYAPVARNRMEILPLAASRTAPFATGRGRSATVTSGSMPGLMLVP